MATIITGKADLLDHQLGLMDTMMDTDYTIKTNRVWDLLPQEIDQRKRHLFPKLFLLSYGSFSKEAEMRVMGMAAVLQYIFLAGEVQRYGEHDPEYPVLVGDYFYSLFFRYVCRYDLFDWLYTLSEMINRSQLQGVSLMEKKAAQSEDCPSIAQEYALFGETACYLGAAMSNAPKRAVSCYQEIGYMIGLLYGMLESKLTADQRISSCLDDLELQIAMVTPMIAHKDKLMRLQQLVAEIKEVVMEQNTRVC